MRILKWIPLHAILALAGCPKATVNAPAATPVLVAQNSHAKKPPKNADHSITLSWQQSFANNGSCSLTVTSSCISGFNEGFISGTSTQNQLHTDTAAVCSGTTQPENCTSTFNGVLPIGLVNFYVATTYIDQNGTAGVTAAVTTAGPATVRADQPNNIIATINN